ncbi:MAG: hypothetical protein PHQ59_03730 [Candidatus Daviesbacteria bacterium]|nr:hypothetical protein [Candidatus Daviesbacteria bacterium]
MLEELIITPEQFVLRKRLVEALCSANPKDTNHSEELRKYIKGLRGKIDFLYNRTGHDGPQASIKYTKSLGYTLTTNDKPVEVPKTEESKLCFVGPKFLKRPQVKGYLSLFHDPKNKRVYSSLNESRFGRLRLTPAQNEILGRLMMTPEQIVSYEELFELEIGHSEEAYEGDFVYGLLKRDYHDKRKRLGDNVTLLRKAIIELYRFVEASHYNLALPISVRKSGYLLSTNHRFYNRIFSA